MNKEEEQDKHEEQKDANDFGAQTYWNRPTGRQRPRHTSKYASLKKKQSKRGAKTATPLLFTGGFSRPSTSPTPSQQSSSQSRLPLPSSAQTSKYKSKEEENDAKDDKAIQKIMKSTLPQFSDEKDWEIAIFELKLVLARVWPHRDELDITDYMTNNFFHRSISEDMETRADNLIYFALTMAAKKDSYAKLQIMAACHRDAVPCVMVNEGKRLFQMFQGQFTMTNLHQASLPTVRVEFYAISQGDTETILAYTSRVDIIVATLAKLGEKVSTGAWIHALGNGLRDEYKECKNGILYSKQGFENVLSVKTKILMKRLY
jgi:hypothetical protein